MGNSQSTYSPKILKVVVPDKPRERVPKIPNTILSKKSYKRIFGDASIIKNPGNVHQNPKDISQIELDSQMNEGYIPYMETQLQQIEQDSQINEGMNEKGGDKIDVVNLDGIPNHYSELKYLIDLIHQPISPSIMSNIKPALFRSQPTILNGNSVMQRMNRIKPDQIKKDRDELVSIVPKYNNQQIQNFQSNSKQNLSQNNNKQIQTSDFIIPLNNIPSIKTTRSYFSQDKNKYVLTDKQIQTNESIILKDHNQIIYPSKQIAPQSDNKQKQTQLIIPKDIQLIQRSPLIVSQSNNYQIKQSEQSLNQKNENIPIQPSQIQHTVDQYKQWRKQAFSDFDELRQFLNLQSQTQPIQISTPSQNRTAQTIGSNKQIKVHKHYGLKHFESGGRYEGELQNDMMHGKGILYFSSGKAAYIGEFENDEFNGQGTLFTQDPDPRVFYKILLEYYDQLNHQSFSSLSDAWIKYEGEFMNDSRNGKGQIQLINGAQFTGTFINDQIVGRGQYQTTDGKIINGIWLNNEFQ